VARSMAYPCGAMSSTLRATTSQPRSLLSIARLNIAKSRLRSAIWSFVRIDQTCFGRSGGLAPTRLPLFSGPRAREGTTEVSLVCMVIVLASENGQNGLSASVPGRRLASAIRASPVAAEPYAWRQKLTHNRLATKKDDAAQHT